MKFLRNACLLLMVAVLAFGGVGMAWGATGNLTLTDPDPGDVLNAGALSGSGGAYQATVFYTGATIPEVKVPLKISETSGAVFDADKELSFDLSPAGVTAPLPASFKSDDTDNKLAATAVTLTVAANPALTGGKLTVTIPVYQKDDTANKATATLVLTYVQVTHTLTFTGAASSTSTSGALNFILNSKDVDKKVTLKASYEESLTEYVSFAGNTITLTRKASPLDTVVGVGDDLWKSETPVAGVTYGALDKTTQPKAPVLTIKTGTNGPTAVKSEAEFILTSDAWKINSATVAGTESGIVLGKITAKVDLYAVKFQKGTTAVSETSPYAATVGTELTAAASSFDVIGIPETIKPTTLKIAKKTATVATGTDAVEWNGLVISADSAPKIRITGTPTSALKESFRVFVTATDVTGLPSATSPVISADFSIEVTPVATPRLVLDPAILTGYTTGVDKYTDVSLTPAATLTDLKLLKSDGTKVVSLDLDGLEVSADLAAKKVFVKGTPASTGDKTLKVWGAWSTGSDDETLIIRVTTPTPAAYTLVLSSSTASFVTGEYDTKVVSASVSPSTGILTDLAVSPSEQNDIKATVDSTTNRITFSGEPRATGTYSFSVSGKVGTTALAAKTVTITVTGSILIDDMVSENPKDWTARTWTSGGHTMFTMSTKIYLPAGVTASDILDVLATFRGSAEYYYEADVEVVDGYAYLKIGGQLTDGKSPSDLVLQAIHILESGGNVWSQSGIGLTLQEVLNAHKSGGGGGGGCSAGGLGIAALALCLGGLLRGKR